MRNARVILSTHARSDYATTVAKAMVVKKAPTVAEAMAGETTDELESRAPTKNLFSNFPAKTPLPHL